MIAHCLFEQSGTFKNEFKKLGFAAYDYDINNDYNETDYKLDLFYQIDQAYNGEVSIFNWFKPDDIIIAFFPCTRFQECNYLLYRGELNQIKSSTIESKLEYAMKTHFELNKHYSLITKLVLVAIKKGLRLIIENPYTQPHYLTEFWPLKPKIIDKDRRENGDHFKKPTQYWFIGFEPKKNLIFESIDYVVTNNVERIKGSDRQRLRSEIHPQYANRFIRQYIIDEMEEINEKT